MKLSTSSSFFLASLALSSSTSTLAAPTRDAADSSLSVSPSSNDMFDASVHPTAHCSAHKVQPQPTPVENKSEALAARSGLPVPPLLCQLLSSLPIVGPLLCQIAGKPSTTMGVADVDGLSAQNISADDIAALQAAVAEVTRLLNGTVVSKQPNAVGSPPIPVAQNNLDPAGAFAAASAAPSSASTMSAQVSSTPSAPVPSSSSAPPSASSTPPSPTFPANPPNTPSLPAHLPV